MLGEGRERRPHRGRARPTTSCAADCLCYASVRGFDLAPGRIDRRTGGALLPITIQPHWSMLGMTESERKTRIKVRFTVTVRHISLHSSSCPCQYQAYNRFQVHPSDSTDLFFQTILGHGKGSLHATLSSVGFALP